MKTFTNVKPHEIVLLNREEIIKIISNTFKSKIINYDKDWTVIESDWEILDKLNDINISRFGNIINEKNKIYFHIGYGDTLLREPSEEFIAVLKRNICSAKFKEIEKSIWLKSYRIFFSSREIPKKEEFVLENTEYHLLQSMGVDGDIRFNQTRYIANWSDNIIGGYVRTFPEKIIK